MKHIHHLALFLIVVLTLSMPAAATPVAANCTSDFSACLIPENVELQLPFLAISGDVVLLEPVGSAVSDVFRIFNNLANTGGGTGVGNLAFLYSSDDSTPLPDPSTYSSNVVKILENPSGVTQYEGNGTDYSLGVPEPSTFALLGVSLFALLGAARKRLTKSYRA
jgi:hypothetical protein